MLEKCIYTYIQCWENVSLWPNYCYMYVELTMINTNNGTWDNLWTYFNIVYIQHQNDWKYILEKKKRNVSNTAQLIKVVGKIYCAGAVSHCFTQSHLCLASLLLSKLEALKHWDVCRGIAADSCCPSQNNRAAQ